MSQDYTLTGFNESNGKTFLDFHRKRDTGDKRDIEIKVKLHNCCFLKNYFCTKQMVLRKSRMSNMAVACIDCLRAGIFLMKN